MRTCRAVSEGRMLQPDPDKDFFKGINNECEASPKKALNPKAWPFQCLPVLQDKQNENQQRNHFSNFPRVLACSDNMMMGHHADRLGLRPHHTRLRFRWERRRATVCWNASDNAWGDSPRSRRDDLGGARASGGELGSATIAIGTGKVKYSNGP